ncbi:hypothetical protein P154DRAFT_486606 [Amniculicola lignicola CBS 123094]|uniref:Glycosyl transferase CAP10 domain-containing protein n=1 Tax=Amniculicola lignicola CBS 123094 TaxID=1392246 RepID=A0A6A5WNX0_9PLEO|nr:hypothetical protein P154DRAFT_486606 [Amniculicola lignicola CBS 123094]
MSERKAMAPLLCSQTLLSSHPLRVSCGIACVTLAFVLTFVLTLHPSEQGQSLLFDGHFRPKTPQEYEGRLQIHTGVPEEHNETNFAEPALKPWDYEYGLSSAECNASFKELYREIDRAVALKKKRTYVTPMDIDISWKETGAVRALIYSQKLYIIEAKFSGAGYQRTRALSILHQIHRAITTSPSPLPNIEFSFAVSDIADPTHSHTIWALSRLLMDENTWLMPDFGYWSWPLELVGTYEQIRAEMLASEADWEDKIPKALWRGAVKTNPVRGTLMEVTRGKSWADVDAVTWKNRTEVAGSNAVSMVDHCRYQFLVHTEGRSYSGRGKYLLNCASVVVAHKSEWIEPHQHLLISSGEHQNFVQVERDFSDLETKVEELLDDPERAVAITRNSVATFRDRYLTPAAQACYWRHLIRSWAEVSFKPKGWEVSDGGKRRRGTPFETFV